jgi:hypothetical protein
MKRVLPLVFVLVVFQVAEAETQRMSQAYERQLVERVRGIFSSQAAGEVERPICATPIFLEVRANWSRLSEATRRLLKPYVERPTYGYPERTYDTPEGHFKIHYVTEGDSAVYQPQKDDDYNGHPDWVDATGQVLEHAWNREVSSLGYLWPPSDLQNPDPPGNGGDGKYDVYLMNLQAGPIWYLGYTQGEINVAQPWPASFTSHIALDNDYLGYGPGHTQLEWLQVTVAHEFFHAIQMAYDGAEYEQGGGNIKPYWMEMSAVWMEEMVYDEINDYLGYLPEFFAEPWLSLKTFESLSDQHAYGSCVWPLFLSEKFDSVIIRDIWERCAEVPGNNVIDYAEGKSATDIVLEAGGSNFEEAFREFTVWNYFTGSRARTELYYSEGDMFPEVKVEDLHYHTTYPATRPSGPHHPENLGSNYVVFVPDPQLKEGGLRIEFTSQGGDFNVSAVGYKSFPHMPLVTPFIGVARIYDWSSYNEVVMIPAVVTRSPDTYFIYEYQAYHDSSLTEEPTQHLADKILQSYPNPFVIEAESDRAFFPFVLYSPSRVRIDVFALSGEKIKTIIPKRDLVLSSGSYTEEPVLRELRLFWDGTNEQGEYVSSGVYTYLFRTDRSSQVKKMAVIR